MARTTAAVYAQLRRDNENDAREALKLLIPDEFFTAEIQDNGEFNLSAKVLLAAKNYLDATVRHDETPDPAKDRPSNPCDDIEKGQPFVMVTKQDRGNASFDEICQLRQVATRLVHKAEEKIQAANGVSEELKEIIDAVSDHMIDIIESIEKTS